MRILLAEDDSSLGDGIEHAMVQAGLTIDRVSDGESAQIALNNDEFDLLILDLGLPKKDGIEVLKYTRKIKNNIPILVLTARDSTEDKIIGLDSGADDYMTKPFDREELLARVRALLRRHSGRTTEKLLHQEIEIDIAARQVYYQKQAITLSRREYALLTQLLQNSGRVLTREQLETSIYGWNDDVESNALEVHIHHLRKKFYSSLIKTIRGIGYMVEE
ncbi:MAG: response regulator transcription factor [Pseudomonadota bacterium]